MKLREAIEILQDRAIPIHQGISQEITDALKLGIEAGKVIQKARDEKVLANTHLLPGETKE